MKGKDIEGECGEEELSEKAEGYSASGEVGLDYRCRRVGCRHRDVGVVLVAVGRDMCNGSRRKQGCRP